MVGIGGEGNLDPGGLCLFHQDAGEHVDLRGPAGVDVLQGGEAGIRADAAGAVLVILDIVAVGGGDQDSLLEEAVVDIAQVGAVDIGLIAHTKDGLGKVVADVEGEFLPLLPADLRGEAVIDAGLRQQPVQGLCPGCLFRCVLFAEDQALCVQVVVDPASDPGGLDDHIGVEDVFFSHGPRDDLLAVDAVEGADDGSVGGGHMAQVVQDLRQAAVLGGDQDEVRAGGLLRGADGGNHLLSVDDQALSAQAVRPLSFGDHAEIVSQDFGESVDEKGADGAGPDQGSSSVFHSSNSPFEPGLCPR